MKYAKSSCCHPELVSGSSRSNNQSGEIPGPRIKTFRGGTTGNVPVWNDNYFGFTLMELLVVVIIIAVLAAVAVPQYKKAVLKSRFSTVMPLAKSLASANEVYYLGNGYYAQNPTELDVDSKDTTEEAYPEGTRVLMYDNAGLSYVRATNDNVPNARYIVYQKHSANFADTTMCEASDDQANALCVALGGTVVEGGNSSGESNWTAYLLTGSYGDNDTFATADDTTHETSETGNSEWNPCEGKENCEVIASNGRVSTCDTMYATVQDGECVVNKTTPINTSYEYVYDETGKLVASYGCLGLTNGHCHDGVTHTYKEDNSADVKRRICANGDEITKEGICPNGYRSYGSTNSNTTDSSKDANGYMTASNTCKTIDAATGNCTSYVGMQTYSPRYSSKNDFQEMYCKQISGTTCVNNAYVQGGGLTRHYDSQGNYTGYTKIACINASVRADGSCSDGWYQETFDENNNKVGLAKYCSNRSANGVDWTTSTCK